MGTARKINAILLNIKINRPKLADMCRYKLATYWQNFMEIYSTGVKILQKVLGGLLFLTRTVDLKICKSVSMINLGLHSIANMQLSSSVGRTVMSGVVEVIIAMLCVPAYWQLVQRSNNRAYVRPGLEINLSAASGTGCIGTVVD